MARKFLYAIVFLVVLVIAAALALRVWGGRLEKIAFVPTTPFEEQAALAGNAYADTAMWLSHPRFTKATDPARWQPDGAAPVARDVPKFAVFFVHPTSYLERIGMLRSTTGSRAGGRGLSCAGSPALSVPPAKSGRRDIGRRHSERS